MVSPIVFALLYDTVIIETFTILILFTQYTTQLPAIYCILLIIFAKKRLLIILALQEIKLRKHTIIAQIISYYNKKY